jgi:uncharacterized OsmC-like protein
MGIAANAHKIEIDGTSVKITKIMANDPRRVTEIIVEFKMTRKYSEKERTILEKAALTCPVALSLHPDLKQSVTFDYQTSVLPINKKSE